MKIKDASEKIGINKNTIRYYTDQGLVPSVKRDANHQRLFDQESLNWLIGDYNLRNSGMSVKELKKYVQLCLQGNQTVEQRYEIIQNLKNNVDQQLKKVHQQAKYLDYKTKLYQAIMNHHSNDDILNPKNWKR